VSRASLVITKQGLSQAEAARTYGLFEATVSRLMARYRAEGEAAFEPRSKCPKASPTALPAELVDLILRLRKELTETGLDARPGDHRLAPGTSSRRPDLPGHYRPLPGPQRPRGP
jgi:hypothetical protein